jgi:hypothetical protein
MNLKLKFMFCFFKMAAKFKMAPVVKKCNFILAAMYLFLGRFEQIKPFWTCHTQYYYIIDSKIKDGTEIQDGAHSRKNVNFLYAVMYLFLGRFLQIKSFWTCHTQFFYIIDSKIKDGTEIQDGAHSKKCDFLLAVLNSEELKVRAM